MAVFTTEEGRLILGYMLEADEMLEDRKTMQCSCATNDVSLNYCPDCGIPNSPCRLLQAFLPHYYGRPKALNRGRPSNIPEVTFHEHRVTKTHDLKFIIELRDIKIPPRAQDNSFTTCYMRGWDRLPLDDLETARANLRDQLGAIGHRWICERFGVYAVRYPL